MKFKFTNHSVSGMSRAYPAHRFTLSVPGRASVVLDVPEEIREKVIAYINQRFPAISISEVEPVKAKETADAPEPEADVPETDEVEGEEGSAVEQEDGAPEPDQQEQVEAKPPEKKEVAPKPGKPGRRGRKRQEP